MASPETAQTTAEGTTQTSGVLSRLGEWLAAGGPVLEVLIGVSVVALAVILLKLYQFARLRIWSAQGMEIALERWQAGHRDEALEALAGARHPVAQVTETTMRNLNRRGADESRVREETQRLASGWLEELNRYLRVLEVIGALSPLMGLLGTVLGMIDAFQQVQSAGNQLSPSLLAGGIWEALLTTAAGLTVAIPTVAALHALEHWVRRVGHRMEDAVTQVFTSRPVAEPAPSEASFVEPRRVGNLE